MKRGQCLKCGSPRVMHDIQLIDRNGEYQDMRLSARIETKPGALIFKGKKNFELKAHICADCGYAELYAMEPDKMWQASEASQGNNHQ